MGRGGELVGGPDSEEVAAQAGVEKVELRRFDQRLPTQGWLGTHERDDARLDERVEPDGRRRTDDAHLPSQFGLVEQAAGSQRRRAEKALERMHVVHAELTGQLTVQVVGDERAEIVTRLAISVGVERRKAAPQESFSERHGWAGGHCFGM